MQGKGHSRGYCGVHGIVDGWFVGWGARTGYEMHACRVYRGNLGISDLHWCG